jgi:hypothetical protein
MKLFILKILAISLFLIFRLSDSYSQSIEKKIYNTSFTGTPPSIDGLMNDDCWSLVEWGSMFTQTQPVENKPPSQQTSFKVLYDNDNLYLYIRAYDNEPGKISQIMSRRDNFDGDMVFVEIDSYFDKQSDFLFAASASGAKSDAAITQDGNNEDDDWNPVWYLKCSVDDKGWNAEMKIPLSQLRFGRKEEHIWGLQVTRRIYRNQERSLWQYVPKGSSGSVHLFGELHGIKKIEPKLRAEIMPYIIGRFERFKKIEGDPFNKGKSEKLSAGLDGKVSLSNDFTLDFTVNPDFGQVEADPSEVNLTAFESYFSEKRPFFVEGKSIFQFVPSQSIVIHNMASDNLFYSRRIGRYPHYSPAAKANEYIKMPEATTILGAVKISGKTKKGLSVGILESITPDEFALIDSAGIRKKEIVEPFTNYFVGRVQKEFNKGETTLGGILTAVNRDLKKNPSLGFLNKAAYTAGIDFQHNWLERTWYIKGNAEFSNISGKPEAITEAQTSSARYYQRPDANYLSVDSSLTTLSGFGSTIKLGRLSKKHLQFETSFTLRSPGLEFNDIGYMRYSDIIHHGTWVAYYMRDPFLIFNNFYLNTNYWMYWNFSGKLISTFTNVNFNSQFKNHWSINGNFTRANENVTTSLLRGGPSITSPGAEQYNLNVSTDQSKKISFNAGGFLGNGDVKSYRDHEYWAGINLRPLNSLSVSIEPQYTIQNNKLQYVNKLGSASDPVYLFAELDQKTLSFTFRLNYTVNPELSIEYYGEPFVSSGKYNNFKRITDPHADRFIERYHTFSPDEITAGTSENSFSIDQNKDGVEDFTFENPDFNFRQFRSNLVVRWEYLPGSTIYLVWSQGRTGSATNGLFSFGNDMKELFKIVPQNIFLIKFSYWFSL